MDKIYLSDKSYLNDLDVVGIPTMINSINEDLINKFIDGFKMVDSNIIYEVNEIYYDPSYDEEGEVIDENRFRLLMNDGNQVYVTASESDNLNRLNYYNEIYASINDKKGYLYLDSGEYGNYGFTPYGSD